MSDDSSNDSGSTDLKQTLEGVNQITRDFETLTAQLNRDSAMIATLSMQSQRSGGRTPANQQTSAVPALLQGVAQSLARQKALGKQLINDVAIFAEALNRWAQDLERHKQQRYNLSPVPSMPVLSGGNETTEPDDTRTPEAHQSVSHDNSGGRPGVLIYTNNWDTYTRYTGSDKGIGQLTSAYVTYIGDDSLNLYLATDVPGTLDPPTYNGVAYCYRVTINPDESWYYYSAKDAQTKAEEGAFITITSLTPFATGFSAIGQSIEDFVITVGRIKFTYVPPADANIQWGAGIKAQGMPWEEFLERKMPFSLKTPSNFETFDFYNPAAKAATSAKTLNTLTLSRLTKPAQLYQQLVKYIDTAADFSEAGPGKEFNLTASEINLRIMQVAIPSKTTAEQMQQLDAAVQYGRSRGIIVIIRKAK
jgi:hypothetical protein